MDLHIDENDKNQNLIKDTTIDSEAVKTDKTGNTKITKFGIDEEEINNKDKKDDLIEQTPLMIIKEIISFSFPTIIFFLAVVLQSTICLIMINKRYSDNLVEANAMKEGMGFAIFIFNLSMLSLIVGLISGFEILGSAAYGAKKYDLIGIYLWKARIVGYAIAIIVLAVLFFAFKPIMIAAGNTDLEIYYGQRFVYFFIFGILFEVLFRSNFIYINISQKSWINSIIVLINLIIFTGICYLMVFQLNLDTLGAGLSILIGQALNALLTTLYMWYYEPIPNTIFMINKKCFKDLWSYLRISLPSTLLMCAEWWSFEILAIFAILSKCYEEHIVVYNVYSLLCTFIGGFATSTTVMCSNAMGEKNHLKARRLFKYNYLFVLSFQTFIGGLFAILNKHIVYLYTTDEEQIKSIQTTIYILSLLTVFDATQYVLNCFSKSCGKLWLTSSICILVLYGVQTLMAFIFSYVFNWGLEGIWLASIIALLILEISYFIIIYMIDYDDAVIQIAKNLDHDKKEIEHILEEEIIEES